ncbi:MAG: hypothetical protein WC759_02875 [Candidatus Micrarchaeia archaeon]
MEQKEGTNELESKKQGLVEEAKRLDRLIYGRNTERKTLEAALNMKKEVPPPGRLKKEADELEFKIATEAFTRKAEQELLKQIKSVKSRMDEAIQVARMKYRLQRIEMDMGPILKQREEVEAKIGEMKKAEVHGRRAAEHEHFHGERQKKAAEWQKKAEERRAQEKKDMEQFIGGVDEGVELGSIAIIKKKKEGESGGS